MTAVLFLTDLSELYDKASDHPLKLDEPRVAVELIRAGIRFWQSDSAAATRSD